jgi:hypothetical protein
MSSRLKLAGVFGVGVIFGVAQICLTQDSSGSAWTASSQQQDPQGVVNPLRIRETHTEGDGRVVYWKSIETLGLDGRYLIYSEIEKESVRVDATTVREIEQVFGRGPDGQRVLIQERREESRELPGGERTVVRTILNPDANGTLEAVQREVQDSRQLGAEERETKTTVLTPDVNGGLTPAVQIEEREKGNDAGAIAFQRSTLLSDGAGHWHLAEVREGKRCRTGNQDECSADQSVLRPDSNGKFAIVERMVGKLGESESEERHSTIDTFSISVPGRAGNDSLQLVQRETIRQGIAGGIQSTNHQIERSNPGNPGDSLQFAQETIDIVGPVVSGVTKQNRTILTRKSDGRLGEVWIEIGETDNRSVLPGKNPHF